MYILIADHDLYGLHRRMILNDVHHFSQLWETTDSAETKTGSSCTLWKSLFYLSVSNSIPLLCLLIKVIQTPCASKGPWKIKQPISWQLFSLISWRQPMGMCLQWWRPGRDSCLGFCTFCNPNTYFALCSAQAKIKYRQTFETVLLLLVVRKRKKKREKNPQSSLLIY